MHKLKKLNAKAVAKDPDAVMDILIKQFGVIDNGQNLTFRWVYLCIVH
jgi:hypothetical protein